MPIIQTGALDYRIASKRHEDIFPAGRCAAAGLGHVVGRRADAARAAMTRLLLRELLPAISCRAWLMAQAGAGDSPMSSACDKLMLAP